MKIFFLHENHKHRIRNKKIIKKWIYRIASDNNKKIDSLSIIFTSSLSLKKINKEFLQHNYFTDVITFDYSDSLSLQGEIYIDFDTVKLNSRLYSERFTKELARVIIHGVFHLLGFDDSSEILKREMRSREDEALIILELHYGFKF